MQRFKASTTFISRFMNPEEDMIDKAKRIEKATSQLEKESEEITTEKRMEHIQCLPLIKSDLYRLSTGPRDDDEDYIVPPLVQCREEKDPKLCRLKIFEEFNKCMKNIHDKSQSEHESLYNDYHTYINKIANI